MKRRTFYVINLDRNRLAVITVLFVGLLAVAYATGFRFGRVQGPAAGVEALSYQDLMGMPEEEQTDGIPAGLPGDAGAVNLEGDRPGELPAGTPESRMSGGRLPTDRPLEPTPPLRGLPPEAGRGSSGLAPLAGARSDTPLAPTPLTGPGAINERDDAARRRAAREQERTRERRLAAERARKERQRKEARDRQRREKERKLAARKARERKEAERQAARQAERRRQASNPVRDNRRSTIGQTVGNERPNERFRNNGRSRLSFEKKQRPASSTPKPQTSNRPERSTQRTQRDRKNGTVSLRNVSPGVRGGRDTALSKSERRRGEREYSLQLGSFSSRDSAFRMASSLKRQGFNPYVYRSGGKFAVRVGKTDRPDHLETLEQRLRRKRYSPMRISYKKKN